MTPKLIFKDLSDNIIRTAFTIHDHFGPGLLESVYESALYVELTHSGIPFERQKVYPLNYKQEYIGAYIANLVVDNTIILELRAELPIIIPITRICQPTVHILITQFQWRHLKLPNLSARINMKKTQKSLSQNKGLSRMCIKRKKIEEKYR
ncbi:MAG: GxxExxY protein [Spirochaetales bacterium]|nr:GxxExxY protein [Spirochaetales bacterium]